MSHSLEFRDVNYPADPWPRLEPRDPQFGVLGPYRDAVWKPRPLDEVIQGYLRQAIRLRVGRERISVSPGMDTGDHFPFTHSVLLISRTFRDYQSRDAGIFAAFETLAAVAVEPSRQWLDRLVIVRDCSASRDLAASLEAPFAVSWGQGPGAGVATVVDVVAGVEVAQTLLTAVQVSHAPCPLIADALPGDLCKKHGGPWVSASMVAALNWSERRSAYLRLLGCDESCPPQPRRVGPVPTRYFDRVADVGG